VRGGRGVQRTDVEPDGAAGVAEFKRPRRRLEREVAVHIALLARPLGVRPAVGLAKGIFRAQSGTCRQR